MPQKTPELPPGPAELAQFWVEPHDLERRDLYYGSGGADFVPPQDVFRFVAKKRGLFAFSPGFEVEDRYGQDWSAKMGPEVRPEVLASRIIWALGYHQPPNHYMARWTLEREGERKVQRAGRFRPIGPPLRRAGNWSWHENPFDDTQAFRGLLVLMALINNWDLTVENTGIYDLEEEWEGTRRWYVVRDIGASFSRNRGALLQGTRGDIEGFEQQGFVRGVEDGRVLFDWNGPHAELFEDLTPADLHWTCGLLSRLRDTQWDAAFRAAGYEPAEAKRLKSRLNERIAQAMRLK